MQSNEVILDIDAPNPYDEYSFGASVAIDDQIVVVGSKSAAHIFDLATGLPIARQPIKMSSVLFDSNYVDTDGGVSIVGSPLEVVDGLSSAGVVHIIDTTDTGLSTVLKSPNPQPGSEFGGSVAILGHLALVGAANDDGGAKTGAAYLFNLQSRELLNRFVAPVENSSDYFGHSVALHGNVAAIYGNGSICLFDTVSFDLLTVLDLQADRGDLVRIAASDRWLVAGSPLASSSSGFASGVVNIFDISYYASGLPGDFNADGTVNIADYTVWRNNSLSVEDYQRWKDNFGRTLSGASSTESTVPEPRSSILILAQILFGFAVLRSSSRLFAHRTLSLVHSREHRPPG
ncbi:FG-GAP repeat protein, partial [Aeoliella sp. ICT_H6.2]|nr:FG-GAP repeat protein [Aeoliella straminimaris]